MPIVSPNIAVYYRHASLRKSSRSAGKSAGARCLGRRDIESEERMQWQPHQYLRMARDADGEEYADSRYDEVSAVTAAGTGETSLRRRAVRRESTISSTR